MGTAAQIRGQIDSANMQTDEAWSALRMALDKIDGAIAMHMVTDSTKLAQAIAQLMQAKQRIEEAMTSLPVAKESASAYAARV